jgi:phosphoribosylanthranilate isomerase
MIKIKICGLSRACDIETVNECQPDYIGFVFAESRRRIGRTQADALKKLLNPAIRTVGVFVNADQGEIVGLCRDGVIDLIQLHGDEDCDYISALKEKIRRPVIKAVRVQNAAQVLEAQSLPCDYLLLDAYRREAMGGTGQSFDHSLIPRLDKPFFLAGGLDSENIKAAAKAQPYCMDVSSGVETNGIKDADKIKEVVRAVRSL